MTQAASEGGNPNLPAPAPDPANQSAPRHGVTPDLFERFLDNQTKEIAIRQHELDLEKQKDSHNFEFSKAALDAQERDRIHERECKRNQYKDRHRLVFWVVLILAGLIVAALYLGSEKLAMEVAKGIGYITAGLLGGYGLAKKGKDDNDQQG